MRWDFENASCVQHRDAFSLKLEDTETWLYEDGEDQQKQVYIDKLAELKVTGHKASSWTDVPEGHNSIQGKTRFKQVYSY